MKVGSSGEVYAIKVELIMSQQTEATWRGKCGWWDERPRWDSDQLRANKLLTQMLQDAQGTTPVLGVPKQKKVFDINDVPWQLRPLLKEFEDTLPHGLPPSRKVGTGQDMHIEVQNGTQPQWRAAYKTSPW